MNQKQLWIQRKSTLDKYHIQGCPTFKKPKVNVVNITPTNTLLHELCKGKVAWQLRKHGMDFITEAYRDGVRRDVVCLDSGEEFEIIAENDTPEIRGKYKKDKVTIIEATWEYLKS